MCNKTINRINGNNKQYTTELPDLIIQGHINDVARSHIFDNTGLNFIKDNWGSYHAKPTNANQIVTLIMTYNYKTRYYNNWNYKNTLFLKHDHHIGFDVDSICHDCCVENRINVNGLEKHDRLAC